MKEPSANVVWPELHCWNRLTDSHSRPIAFEGIAPGCLIAEYPAGWRDDRLPVLMEAFETIRTFCGGHPIRNVSAYRTATYNRAVGGADRSQHVEGRALDLKPPEGMSVYDFWQAIVELASGGKIPVHGIGYASPSEGSYVHIDTRPGPGLAQWRYPLK